jgi:signal transduction histidine kinase
MDAANVNERVSAPAASSRSRARWGMQRTWVWIQLLIGWLPVWALFAALIVFAHPGTAVQSAIFAGFRSIACAALLGLGVNRLTQRYPWPVPMRPGFVARHAIAAPLYAALWVALSTILESAISGVHSGRLQFGTRAPLVPFFILGVWFYAMVAGVSYASQAAQRAAAAEAMAATARLSTLRSQLNPHFLFNALHTVVQLIPQEPKRATAATEQLASLLRTSLEEARDLIRLADEWSFVERYVALERLRFGDRLQVTMTRDESAGDALVPSFAIQTLVENAVRHGASPNIDATEVQVSATADEECLSVTVRDTGVGADASVMGHGSGLERLRDRLHALYGAHGTLRVETSPGAGFLATIRVPRHASVEHDS